MELFPSIAPHNEFKARKISHARYKCSYIYL